MSSDLSSPSDTALTGRPAALGTQQKVGLVLALVYAVTNLPSVFLPPDTGDQAGPPISILAVDTVLAVIALVAGVLAWRGNRIGLRVCAGADILITLTSLPAFFVDVPMAIKVLVGVGVVWTVVMVVLMFSEQRPVSRVVD